MAGDHHLVCAPHLEERLSGQIYMFHWGMNLSVSLVSMQWSSLSMGSQLNGGLRRYILKKIKGKLPIHQPISCVVVINLSVSLLSMVQLAGLNGGLRRYLEEDRGQETDLSSAD